MMGDGHIDFTSLRAAVDAAGYSGDIEVEIFNEEVWASDPREVLRTMVERYLGTVCGPPHQTPEGPRRPGG